jgi:hypothetical protein
MAEESGIDTATQQNLSCPSVTLSIPAARSFLLRRVSLRRRTHTAQRAFRR